MHIKQVPLTLLYAYDFDLPGTESSLDNIVNLSFHHSHVFTYSKCACE